METLNQLVEICALPPSQTASKQCHHNTQQVSAVMHGHAAVEATFLSRRVETLVSTQGF